MTRAGSPDITYAAWQAALAIPTCRWTRRPDDALLHPLDDDDAWLRARDIAISLVRGGPAHEHRSRLAPRWVRLRGAPDHTAPAGTWTSPNRVRRLATHRSARRDLGAGWRPEHRVGFSRGDRRAAERRRGVGGIGPSRCRRPGDPSPGGSPSGAGPATRHTSRQAAPSRSRSRRREVRVAVCRRRRDRDGAAGVPSPHRRPGARRDCVAPGSPRDRSVTSGCPGCWTPTG